MWAPLSTWGPSPDTHTHARTHTHVHACTPRAPLQQFLQDTQDTGHVAGLQSPLTGDPQVGSAPDTQAAAPCKPAWVWGDPSVPVGSGAELEPTRSHAMWLLCCAGFSVPWSYSGGLGLPVLWGFEEVSFTPTPIGWRHAPGPFGMSLVSCELLILLSGNSWGSNEADQDCHVLQGHLQSRKGWGLYLQRIPSKVGNYSVTFSTK